MFKKNKLKSYLFPFQPDVFIADQKTSQPFVENMRINCKKMKSTTPMTEIEMNNKIVMLPRLSEYTFATASGFPLSYLF